ncbi:MAG: hypothetical protein HY840_07415 [Bacteroidetes bacterium]|nr:hypothetical protein [Bacteroidota bacterium]
MKYIIYCLLFTIYCLPASAQSRCVKGTWVIGLSPVSYNIFGYNTRTGYIADTLSSTSKSKSNDGLSVGFGISGGYFVRNNFCIGAGWNTLNAAPFLPTTLFARYYLMQKKRCFAFTRQDNTRRSAFFMQGLIVGYYNRGGSFANANYSSNNTLIYESKSAKGYSYMYGPKIAIGYTYMFAKHVAFEIMIAYNYYKSGDESSGGGNQYGTGAPTLTPSSKSITTSSNLNMFFGVQTYF